VAAKRFHSADVRFIGVDIEDNTASAEAYMRHFDINYPSLADPADKIALHFSQVVPTTAFPSTLVISPSQRITGRIIGAASSRALMQLIERAEKQSK
jgi:alkyl hydroperoxide reductase subunit AhpC